jgi:hypothetical protein
MSTLVALVAGGTRSLWEGKVTQIEREAFAVREGANRRIGHECGDDFDALARSAFRVNAQPSVVERIDALAARMRSAVSLVVGNWPRDGRDD